MIRIARVISALVAVARPESSSASVDQRPERSVSKTEGTSCWIAAIRSRPRPVSMFCFGSSVSEPSSCSS